ncbi:MAG: 7TM diverse intracellular signaling domain-containing protein [Ramlibacter sp.]
MRRAWLLAVLCWWAAAAGAQAPLAVGDQGRYVLLPHLAYFEDETGKLTIEDVAAPAQQARFRPVVARGPAANFGMVGGAIWLRAELHARAGSDPHWLLELAYPPLDHVALYAPAVGGGWERQVAGDREPPEVRPLSHRNHVLPLRLERPVTVVYLRLASEGVVAAPVRLWRAGALWRDDQVAYAALALYFGLLGGLLLYNLLLFASVRDPAYLVYVLFVASMGLAQGSLTGLGTQFVWPGWPWWNSVAPHVGVALAGLFGLLFARRFLQSREALPRVDRLLQWQAALWALTAAAAVALPYIVSARMLQVLAPVGIVSLLGSGVLAMRRGHGGARYYLAAWAVLCLGVFVLLLHNMGLVPSDRLTSHSLLIGSAVEMVLLSTALGDRINVARRLREQAQARLAAEHAMVEALSDSERRLKRALEEREIILENSIVGICFLTAEGRLRWANAAMREIFGAGGRPVTSMEPFYLSHEQYRQVGAEVASAVARGDVYQRELEVQQFDGTRIWILLSGKAVNRDDLGKGTVWVIMDITERKRLQEQLERTMREREAILNNAVVGIVLSVRRRHEWVNEKFAQMLGYPRQVLIGQGSDYLHPDTETWQRFGVEARDALIATNGYVCEMELKRRDGTLFWVEMGGSCVRPHDPDAGVIWTFLDITGRKKSDAEMREALEQQKALNELRSRFVAMTSHEFRTPLAAILSAEEVLRHYGDRLSAPERNETLDSIAAGVQRMSRMMDRVLLLGRADARLLECQPAPVDLRTVCRELVEEARLQQPASRAEVVWEVAPEVARGSYDEKLLRHIFGNLLSNALKYSPAGGHVLLRVERDGDEAVFRVRDQGIGIPAEEIPHLFESFHRASNVGDIPGTGLGLAIVKDAVDAHGGTIAVESGVGKGTVFTVRLPLAAAAVAS